MLKFIGAYIGLEVVSIREEIPIAEIVEAIVSPSGLKIIGFYCFIPDQNKELVLLSDDSLIKH